MVDYVRLEKFVGFLRHPIWDDEIEPIEVWLAGRNAWFSVIWRVCAWSKVTRRAAGASKVAEMGASTVASDWIERRRVFEGGVRKGAGANSLVPHGFYATLHSGGAGNSVVFSGN